MSKPQISVLILTLNEEINIVDCINSVKWADDVVVLDSFSSDKTVELARTAGASVVQRKFDNWASHQNWALANINFKYDWIFYIDADERCDQQLCDELVSFDTANSPYAMLYMRRKDYFLERWLKHAQIYPVWQPRLFRRDKVRYERPVNPVEIVDGDTSRLTGHFIHYPFSHGIASWINRHNNYSDFEAAEKLRIRKLSWKEVLFDKNAVRRNKLKHIVYRLPLRPLIMYCYLVLLRLAFLDGAPGMKFVSLRVMYERLIDIKYAELKRKETAKPEC